MSKNRENDNRWDDPFRDCTKGNKVEAKNIKSDQSPRRKDKEVLNNDDDSWDNPLGTHANHYSVEFMRTSNGNETENASTDTANSSVSMEAELSITTPLSGSLIDSSHPS